MTNEKIKVDISSRFPIFIEANADAFGQIFANMADDDQLRVLASMVEHMKPHKLQWDYIALKLEKDEHREVRDQLRYALLPTDATADLLDAANAMIARWPNDQAPDGPLYDEAANARREELRMGDADDRELAYVQHGLREEDLP